MSQSEFASAAALPDNVTPITATTPKRLGGYIERRVEAASPEANPIDLLRDLRVPDPPFGELRRALEQCGYTVEEEELHAPYDKTWVSWAFAIRLPPSPQAAYLIHVPPQILRVSKQEYHIAVGSFERLFPQNSSITMVSSELLDTHGSYLRMMDDWQRVKASFVSWGRLVELQMDEYEPGAVARDLKISEALGEAGGDNGDEGGDALTKIVTEILTRELQVSVLEHPIADVITNLELTPEMASQVDPLRDLTPSSAAIKLVTWSKGRDLGGGRMVLGVLMANLATITGEPHKTRLWELIAQHRQLPPKEILERRGE